MSPNYFGRNITVEDCSKIFVGEYLQNFGTRAEAVLGSVIEVGETKVTLAATPANLGGLRFWFLCPHCNCRIAVLLIHPVTGMAGCRRCLGVDYRAKRFKGMLEGDLLQGVQ